MKTDAALKRDVEAELAWEPALHAASLHAAVRHGGVTLSGQVHSLAEKHAAARAVRRVAGVKGLALDVGVQLPPEDRRGDTDIALSAEEALRWHAQVSARIQVIVDKGWVTVRGEVEWDWQRRSIEETLGSLRGIVGLASEVTLHPRAKPVEMQQGIAEALRRQAGHAANHMAVSVDGATVILRGTVASWHERDAVRGAAWSAPGVRAVIDELRIA